MQERKIYVFGGWDTPVCYNDMYMLDLGERMAFLSPPSHSQCCNSKVKIPINYA